MVKVDFKHNYYADLDLPQSASIEDVRKAYRKLALQYHPDRNAGREEECVPKFQAIQSAIEVLGEPMSKQKYDTDRKRVGINPLGQTFNPRQPGPGNPYAANSHFPPPPRRTQPGAWQRTAPNGADRFSNFPKPAPTARNDAAQDTTNRFKAWEKMQPRQGPQPQPRPPPFVHPQQAPPPQANRPRPAPPPRQETRFPSEEQMKAGMRSSNMPPPNFDTNKTAWDAFKGANAGKPGMPRNAPPTTPRRQGFNPNMPGSDEKPADAHHFHRKHSGPNMNAPPPPNPPPTSAPVSPVSPTTKRPYPDPTRPHTGRTPNDQVPFAEGNRDRTPYGSSYASYIRERTDLGDGLRRSYSTRDTTKLGPDDAASRSRARSTSPLRRQRASESHAKPETKKAGFDLGSDRSYSSSGSSDNLAPNADGAESERPGTAPNSVPPFDRPKKKPTPPSSRFNGTRSGASSPPPMPYMPNVNGAADGAQSEGEHPSMQQKANSNMYATLSFSCNPAPKSPKHRKSDSPSTWRARRAWSNIGRWAVPSSVNPFLRVQPVEETTYVTAADEMFKNATKDEQSAYLRFHALLREWFEYVPDNFDMEVFLKLASTARPKVSCGDPLVDRLLDQVLSEFPILRDASNNFANGNVFGNSFNFSHDSNRSESTKSKSRSEENINTNFSSEPWSGEFGQYDFAPPPPTGRKISPTRRTTRTRTPGEQPRSATMDDSPATAPPEGMPQRPWGSDGQAKDNLSAASAGGTSQDQFQNPFWPPPSVSPTRSGAASQPRKQSQGRKTSKASNRSAATAKSTQRQSVVDEDDTIEVEGADGTPEHGAPVMGDPEPMDIDNTPPAQNGVGLQQSQNEAKLYSMPRSQKQNAQRQRKTSSAARKPVPAPSKLKANLDDLRNIEPIGKSADSSGGLNSLESMSATLPVQSQAAANIIKPNRLSMPSVPKAPAEPTKLTKVSWSAYVQSFAAYVRAFHDFNQAMIQHFAAREQLNDLNFKDPTKWLEAAGDTSGLLGAPTGFGTYQAMVQEDEQVREHWNVGCDKHAEAIQAFGKVRDRVRKLVEGSGLADH